MALDVSNRRAKTQGGERFSILLAGAPQTPLFYRTVFAVEQRRSAGLAANTLWRDPAQLPPIGPGQVFSSVLAGNRIPRVELDLPQRQRGGSVIPAVALAIREGRLPDLPTFDPSSPDREGVYILPTPRAHAAIAKAIRSSRRA
jgi:hypothetical protein